MGKITRCEQNDDSARGIDSRRHIGVAGDARKIDPRAKTPGVGILTIRVPVDVLDALNELAAKQYRTRSNFVRHELLRIIAESRAQTP